MRIARSRLAGSRWQGMWSCVSTLVALWALLAGSQALAGAFDVVISEIHYHPPLSADGDELHEFVELMNLSDESVMLEGWKLSNGVDFVFPSGATVGPSGYALVARDPASLESAHGLSGVFGPFTGRLSNDGEILELRNAQGQLIDRAPYGDSDPWPENPDGFGPSLEKVVPTASGEASSSWRSSILLGGTPGSSNSIGVEPAHDIEINEVWSDSAGFVELFNEGATTVDLSGWKLTASPVGASSYAFPPGTTLAPGAFRSIPAASLPFGLSSQPQWIGLTTADLRFVDGLETRAQPQGRSFGRHPDGDGDTFVLDAPTSGSANAYTPDTSIAINELQYHPPLGSDTAEYVELINRGTQPVNLFGWRLDKAVRFTFSSVVLQPGGFLVVSGNPALVESRHGIAGVVGPWKGKLSNDADKVELKDALGNRVDTVHYADDGSWPASTVAAGPDGHGPSIELVHPAMEGNHGSAWLASTGIGTPGAANSKGNADPAPVVRSVEHSPPMPRSQDAVTVTARVSDERSVSSVKLFSRTDGAATFTQAAMLDDGLHGDGAAGDGRYGASLIKRANGTIVQFYVEALDDTGHVRRFPSNAPTGVCLYQVDDRVYPSNLTLYRAVLKAADLSSLESRSVDSDVLLPASFIHGKHVFYNVGLRYRGDNSRNFELKAFRFEFFHDEPFEGITNLNLNVEDIHLADLAADFIRRADVPVFDTQPVSFTLNNAWQTKHGGLYLRVEAVDSDFLKRVYPGDDSGNLYRGRDPSGPGEADLKYLGSNPASYVDFYEKKTNSAQNDYTDIIALTNAFTNATDANFPSTMSALLDVDEWLRYFAVETVLSNQDGAIATDTGEDYMAYHRPSDGKWVLIPWDQNENFQNPEADLYHMGIAAVRRLVLNPAFVGAYQRHILDLISGPFSEDVMFRQAAAKNAVYGVKTLEPIVDFIPARIRTLERLLPSRLSVGVEPRYFARSGDQWRYFRGTKEPSNGTTAWTGINFADTTWPTGPGGFGYGDGDDRTTLTDMEGNYTTVYIRRAFNLDSVASIGALRLSVRFDDGFVAYLNGSEIARRDASGTVTFQSKASSDHEAGAPEVIDVSSFRNLLRVGKNVIALVGLNSSSSSSDLTLDPELYADPAGTGCGAQLLAQGSALSLGGSAPMPDTERVEVNGAPAVYDPLTGSWHADVDIPTGSGTFEVTALGAGGDLLESFTTEVTVGGVLTPVSGSVTTTHWTLSKSPYHVTGSVTVPSGSTLTIDPGVVVYVDAGASLVVRGTLATNGTAAQPVALRASSCSSAWGGLVFPASTSRGTLLGLVMDGASLPVVGATTYPAAVTLAAGADVRLENSTLSSFSGPAIDLAGGSKLVILDSLIEETGEAIHTTSSFAQIERVTMRRILGKSDCIDFDGDSSPRSIIRSCLLEDGSDDGVDLGQASPLVENNVIRRMGCKGFSIEGASTALVTGNLIHDCNDGMVAKDGATPLFRHNTVSGCNVGIHFYEKNPGQGGGKGTVESSIVWGNGRSVLLDGLSTVGITFTDIQGGYAGTGNLASDPMFVNPLGGDFHLLAGSPASGAAKDGTEMGAFSIGAPVEGVFIRGDANLDSSVDISDAVTALLYLFGGRSDLTCLDALDSDDSGQIDITDPIALLDFLFRGGNAPASPFPARGSDPTTDDDLTCVN